MVGAIISAVAGIGSMIYGGIKSSKERKKAQQALEKQEQEARMNFNRDYYADLTQRADMRFLLNKQREQLNEANTTARQRNIVAGGTTESGAVAKKASNKALAESTARIGALSQQQKQAAVANYNQARQGIYAGHQKMYNTAAQQGANFAASGANMVVNGVSGLADNLAISTPQSRTASNAATPQSNADAIQQGEVVPDYTKPEDNPLLQNQYA